MLAKISCDQVIGVHGIEKAEIDIFIPLEVGGTQNGFSFELPAKLLGRLANLGFDLIVTAR